MEVSLVEAEGLPEGCLLSVRAGNLRRQAPAEPDKCRLSFPPSGPCGEGLRVEALEAVAGAKLELEAGVEHYDLALQTRKGSPMRVSLRVRDLATGASGFAATAGGLETADIVQGLPPPTPRGGAGGAGRRHLAALSARRYLEEKGLLQWVQSLFQELVREQPDDPWPHVDKHSRLSRPERPRAQAPQQDEPLAVAEPSPSPAPAAAPADPSESAPAPREALAPQQSPLALRSMLRKALSQAASDGTLAQELKEHAEPVQASAPPRPEALQQPAPDALRARARRSLEQATIHAPQPPPTPRLSPEALRARARRTLEQAAQDEPSHRPEPQMQPTQSPPPPPQQQQPPPPPQAAEQPRPPSADVDIDSLRRKTLVGLERAAREREEQAQPGSPFASLRQRAAQGLEKAAMDRASPEVHRMEEASRSPSSASRPALVGRSATTLSGEAWSPPPKPDAETLRKQALERMEQGNVGGGLGTSMNGLLAAEDGVPGSVLAQAAEQVAPELAAAAAAAAPPAPEPLAAQVAQQGALVVDAPVPEASAALAAAPEGTSTVAVLRSRARSLFEKAALEDGRLARVHDEARAGSPEAGESVAKSSEEDLKTRARRALSSVALGGGLVPIVEGRRPSELTADAAGAAVEEGEREAGTQEARSKVGRALFEAALDGSLVAALEGFDGESCVAESPPPRPRATPPDQAAAATASSQSGLPDLREKVYRLLREAADGGRLGPALQAIAAEENAVSPAPPRSAIDEASPRPSRQQALSSDSCSGSSESGGGGNDSEYAPGASLSSQGPLAAREPRGGTSNAGSGCGGTVHEPSIALAASSSSSSSKSPSGGRSADAGGDDASPEVGVAAPTASGTSAGAASSSSGDAGGSAGAASGSASSDAGAGTGAAREAGPEGAQAAERSGSGSRDAGAAPDASSSQELGAAQSSSSGGGGGVAKSAGQEGQGDAEASGSAQEASGGAAAAGATERQDGGGQAPGAAQGPGGSGGRGGSRGAGQESRSVRGPTAPSGRQPHASRRHGGPKSLRELAAREVQDLKAKLPPAPTEGEDDEVPHIPAERSDGRGPCRPRGAAPQTPRASPEPPPASAGPAEGAVAASAGAASSSSGEASGAAGSSSAGGETRAASCGAPLAADDAALEDAATREAKMLQRAVALPGGSKESVLV